MLASSSASAWDHDVVHLERLFKSDNVSQCLVLRKELLSCRRHPLQRARMLRTLRSKKGPLPLRISSNLLMFLHQPTSRIRQAVTLPTCLSTLLFGGADRPTLNVKKQRHMTILLKSRDAKHRSWRVRVAQEMTKSGGGGAGAGKGGSDGERACWWFRVRRGRAEAA